MEDFKFDFHRGLYLGQRADHIIRTGATAKKALARRRVGASSSVLAFLPEP